MKKVFSSDELFSVQQVKQLLEEHDIPFIVKNEFASGAIGELSPLDALPEVWLLDEEWHERVQKLISQMHNGFANRNDWRCHACGENNTAAFEFCWKCGREYPHA